MREEKRPRKAENKRPRKAEARQRRTSPAPPKSASGNGCASGSSSSLRVAVRMAVGPMCCSAGQPEPVLAHICIRDYPQGLQLWAMTPHLLGRVDCTLGDGGPPDRARVERPARPRPPCRAHTTRCDQGRLTLGEHIAPQSEVIRAI